MEQRTRHLAVTLSVLSVLWVACAVTMHPVYADERRTSAVEERRLQRMQNMETNRNDLDDIGSRSIDSGLSVHVTSPRGLVPGRIATFRITVENTSGEVAERIRVQHRLQDEGGNIERNALRFNEAASPKGCTVTKTGSIQEIQCMLDSLRPNERKELRLVYNVSSCTLGVTSSVMANGMMAFPHFRPVFSSAYPARLTFSLCSPSDVPTI